VACNGVLFSKDAERALHIHCHSDWDIENTTADMAKAKIARAKGFWRSLRARVRRFKESRRACPTDIISATTTVWGLWR
jgi:hypothetical protein